VNILLVYYYLFNPFGNHYSVVLFSLYGVWIIKHMCFSWICPLKHPLPPLCEFYRPKEEAQAEPSYLKYSTRPVGTIISKIYPGDPDPSSVCWRDPYPTHTSTSSPARHVAWIARAKERGKKTRKGEEEFQRSPRNYRISRRRYPRCAGSHSSSSSSKSIVFLTHPSTREQGSRPLIQLQGTRSFSTPLSPPPPVVNSPIYRDFSPLPLFFYGK
jgi:hypothetical protein